MIHNTRAGQQFRQLPMFMSAREIRQDYQALDGDRDEIIDEFNERIEDDPDLFARKYKEASQYPSGLTNPLAGDILRHGVKNPISLQEDHTVTGSRKKPEILGGHHRVAVMERHKPDTLMPVEHFESQPHAAESLRDKY